MRADADTSDDASRPSTSASPAPFSHLTFLGGRGRDRGAVGDGASTNAGATQPQKDCFSCRVLGVSACGVGAAAVMWEIYKEPRRKMSHRYAMGAFAAAFVAMGAYRAVI